MPTVAIDWCWQLIKSIDRTLKEVASYEKEIVDQTNKIETMRENGRDSHDIKQQVLQ